QRQGGVRVGVLHSSVRNVLAISGGRLAPPILRCRKATRGQRRPAKGERLCDPPQARGWTLAYIALFGIRTSPRTPVRGRSLVLRKLGSLFGSSARHARQMIDPFKKYVTLARCKGRVGGKFQGRSLGSRAPTRGTK